MVGFNGDSLDFDTINFIVPIVQCYPALQKNVIGKKVEVSLRLFYIFERNMVFIFLWESCASHPADWGLQ